MPSTKSTATSAISSNMSLPQTQPSNPSLVYDQEIPENSVALERARASLREWEEQLDRFHLHQAQRVGSAATVEETGCSCSCPHILEYLPETLSFEFGVLNPESNQSLWLSHPIHALHLSSQGLTDLTKSAAALAAKHSNQPVTKPILYGEEQERLLAVRLPGLHSQWHPLQLDQYHLKPPTAAKGSSLSSSPKAKRKRLSETSKAESSKKPDSEKTQDVATADSAEQTSSSPSTETNNAVATKDLTNSKQLEKETTTVPSSTATESSSQPPVLTTPQTANVPSETTDPKEELKSTETKDETPNELNENGPDKDNATIKPDTNSAQKEDAPLNAATENTKDGELADQEKTGDQKEDAPLKAATEDTKDGELANQENKQKVDVTDSTERNVEPANDEDKDKKEEEMALTISEPTLPQSAETKEEVSQESDLNEKPGTKLEKEESEMATKTVENEQKDDDEPVKMDFEKETTREVSPEIASSSGNNKDEDTPKVKDETETVVAMADSSTKSTATQNDEKESDADTIVTGNNETKTKSEPEVVQLLEKDTNDTKANATKKEDEAKDVSDDTKNDSFEPMEVEPVKEQADDEKTQVHEKQVDDNEGKNGPKDAMDVELVEKDSKEEAIDQKQFEQEKMDTDSLDTTDIKREDESPINTQAIADGTGTEAKPLGETLELEEKPDSADSTVMKPSMTSSGPPSENATVDEGGNGETRTPPQHNKSSSLDTKSTIVVADEPKSASEVVPLTKTLDNESQPSASKEPQVAPSINNGKDSKHDNASKPLLSDAVFRQYQSKEMNSVAISNSMFGKRQLERPLPPSQIPKPTTFSSGTTSSQTGTGADKKRRKMTEKATHLTQLSSYKAPTIKHVAPPNISIVHKRQQEKATRQVERWVGQYRLSSRCIQVEKAEKQQCRIRGFGSFDKNFVFGAIQDEEEETNDEFGSPGIPESPCALCMSSPLMENGSALSSTMLHCLDCGHVACHQHMQRHMVLKHHWLAVTAVNVNSTSLASAERQLYCFHCNRFFQHIFFLQEEERLVLEEELPHMAWNARNVVHRSFDPLRFIKIPDIGIVWNGFYATYPINVPRHHIRASRICRLRLQLIKLAKDNILERLKENKFLPNNSRTRNRSLMKELALLVKEKISKPVGMYNLGNTCYQSAVFQCLIHCLPLQQFFLHKVGHSSGSCQIYRRQSMKRLNRKQNLDSVCLACELDKLFLHYQSRCSGVNVSQAIQDLTHQAMQSPYVTKALVSDPLAVLEKSGAVDGAVVERITVGEPLVEQKDMLAATWKCKEMAHLAGYEQRDAHEFLHAFLEVLGQHSLSLHELVYRTFHQHTSTKIPPQANVVKDLFEGSLRSVLICQECGAKRIQKESFVSISLDLSKEVRMTSVAAQLSPTQNAPLGSVGTSPIGPAIRRLSVEKCLLHFTAPEQLHDPVGCPECAKKTRTKKQHTVSKLPPILCLHLKRFHGAAAQQKLEDYVSFPAKGLNMGAYLPHWCEDSGLPSDENSDTTSGAPPPDAPYSLFATVNHYGNLQSGHYVSNVKIDDQWYHCNDSHVSHTTESQVLQSNAYLLFYEYEKIGQT